MSSLFHEYLSRVRDAKNYPKAASSEHSINLAPVNNPLLTSDINPFIADAPAQNTSKVLSEGTNSQNENRAPLKKSKVLLENSMRLETPHIITPTRRPLVSLNENVPLIAPKKYKVLSENSSQKALLTPVVRPILSPSVNVTTAQNDSKLSTSVLVHESGFENSGLATDDESASEYSEASDEDNNIDDDTRSKFNSKPCKEWLLKDILPDGWEYAGFSILKKGTNFNVSVCINLTSKIESEKWVNELSQKSSMDFRIRKTFPTMSKQRATYKILYRCHNNTMADMPSCKTKTPHYKHVKCPFLMLITIRNTKMTRSEGDHLQSHPCVVLFQNILHNHPIQASDVLRHRRPREDVVEKFTNLFKQNHSPSSALNTHKFDLQEEFGSEYIRVSADGSRCPSLKWCYYWYKKMFSEVYGPQDGLEMVESLKKFVSEYNEECGSECSKFRLTEDGQYMVAICTPLMKKVHKFIKGSSEIAFVDSGGCMDRHSSKVFLIMTPSVAGALPLGIVVTSSETEVLLKEAFQLWMSILPENAFYGKNMKGPSLFMTDDCASERNTLKFLFPDAILLLCIFHVLQAVWRWLLDSNHKIDKVDKPIIYNLFKDILKADTAEKLWENYETMKNHPDFQKYSKARDYFSKLMLRVSEWALCYRLEYLIRGHNTNNYCEATMRILKDHIFFRTKAFSLVQLFHFLTTRIDKYFERRIVAVINNRLENYVKSRYHIKKEKLTPLSCSKESEHFYKVHNSESNKSYTVNMDVETCTCPVGKTGAPCKHQYAVVLEFNLSSNQFLPFSDEKAKRNLYELISDSSVELPQEWFTTLRNGVVNPFEPRLVDAEENLENVVNPVNDSEKDVNIPEVAPSCCISEADNGNQAKDIAECLQDIDVFADDLKKKLTSSPDVFLPAVQKMIRRYKSEIKTDSAFVSALHSFNRFNSSAMAVHPASNIPKQVTTPARRKYVLSGANHPYITGRPPNEVRLVPEHGYRGAQKKPPIFVQRSSTKAPHCISQRVNSYAYHQS